MHDLTEPVGLVALAAGAIALVALVVALTLAVKLRRVRAAQEVVLGAGGRDDLIAHASGLHGAFEELHGRVEEVAGRLDGAIAHRALVRYDAYGELSGHQSISLALLDSDRNGVVLSSIAHRDTARLYCRQVFEGRGEHELSPEEDEAIRLALTGEAPRTVTLD